MTCVIKLYEEPRLTDPVLIEGLPGIGFVANLATSFLIKELDARLFGEVSSSAFQDVAIMTNKSRFMFPNSKLYYYKGRNAEHDLILLYGVTQALTTRGQYELCWRILETAKKLNCNRVITLGGYRPGREVHEPRLYYAASDTEVAREAKSLGAEVLSGQIFGVAGLLIGLCRIHNMRGYCLLAETLGDRPDKEAACEILKALMKVLGLKLDLKKDITPLEDMPDLKLLELKPHMERRETLPEWLV